MSCNEHHFLAFTLLQVRVMLNILRPGWYFTLQKGFYWLQPLAAELVAATNVTLVYQTNFTLVGPTYTFSLCSNVLVGPANIKLVRASNVTLVASS